MAGGILFLHLCRNPSSAPRGYLEVGAQIETRAVTGEQGPYKQHMEAHTISLSILV